MSLIDTLEHYYADRDEHGNLKTKNEPEPLDEPFDELYDPFEEEEEVDEEEEEDE